MSNQIVTETPDTRNANHPLLTVHEVAEILRVDDTTVRRWVKGGVLEAVSLPHKDKRQAYRIKRTTVDKLFNQVNTQPTEHVHHKHHKDIEE